MRKHPIRREVPSVRKWCLCVCALLIALVGLSPSAGADYDYRVDADVFPRMAPEEVADMVRASAAALAVAGIGAGTTDTDQLISSLRCTRADRLWTVSDESGRPDNRAVWVVEVSDKAGADAAFFVIDDQDGAVLAHGAMSRADASERSE